MSFRRVIGACSVIGVLALPAMSLGAQSAPAPATGQEVFQRMHDAYAGKWYRTLRFVQKTTQYRPDGSIVIATWYESLRQTDAATQLRIDLGDPRQGNGIMYTADSTWRVVDGKVTNTQGSGNEFLPLIEGVYMQPVSRTVAQLAGTGVDMGHVMAGAWENRPAWIIGAATAADSAKPQIWIDRDRNVIVRMMLVPAPNAPLMDIRLGDYVQAGQGWLATKVTMLVGGKPRQIEDYADWKTGIELPNSLFAIATWKTTPHWAER